MAEDWIALTRTRAMLTVLLATCQQSEHVVASADHAIDPGLADDLRRITPRIEEELAALNAKLGSRGTN